MHVRGSRLFRVTTFGKHKKMATEVVRTHGPARSHGSSGHNTAVKVKHVGIHFFFTGIADILSQNAAGLRSNAIGKVGYMVLQALTRTDGAIQSHAPTALGAKGFDSAVAL